MHISKKIYKKSKVSIDFGYLTIGSGRSVDTTLSLLAGKRIVSTRPEAQTSEFITLLSEAGATPVIFPTIAIMPVPDNPALDHALGNLRDYRWLVFTSANGVRVVVERLKALGLGPAALGACRIAVIGPATAAELAVHGLQADLKPEEFVAEALAEALLAFGPIDRQRFLLLRADIARATLHQQLLAHGAIVDEIPVYQTVRGTPDPAAYAELRSGVDVITFTSSSTVRYFFDLLSEEAPSIARHAMIACIGPVTAQTARELGLRVDLVAEEYTIPGLVQALKERFSR